MSPTSGASPDRSGGDSSAASRWSPAHFVAPTSDGRSRRLIRTYPVPDGAPETTSGSVTSPPGVPGVRHRSDRADWMLGIFDGSLFEARSVPTRPPVTTRRPWRRRPDRVIHTESRRHADLHQRNLRRVPGRVARDRQLPPLRRRWRRRPAGRQPSSARRAVDGRALGTSRSTFTISRRRSGEPLSSESAAGRSAWRSSRAVRGWPSRTAARCRCGRCRGATRKSCGRPAKAMRALAIDPARPWIASGGDDAPP